MLYYLLLLLRILTRAYSLSLFGGVLLGGEKIEGFVVFSLFVSRGRTSDDFVSRSKWLSVYLVGIIFAISTLFWILPFGYPISARVEGIHTNRNRIECASETTIE